MTRIRWTRALTSALAVALALVGCKEDAPAGQQTVDPAGGAETEAPAAPPAEEGAEAESPSGPDVAEPEGADAGSAAGEPDAGESEDEDEARQAQEKVIAEAIQAALEEDESKGWERFSALLHSEERHPNSLRSWRSNNFAAFRRKVHLYVDEDAEGTAFEIVRVLEQPDGRVRLFVKNDKSMPTPCTLRQDDEADGAWRIDICSL